MEVHRVERWLAAILIADMVGYNRLMEADEAGAQGTEVVKINAKFTLRKYAESLTDKARDHATRTLEARRKAGLPE